MVGVKVHGTWLVLNFRVPEVIYLQEDQSNRTDNRRGRKRKAPAQACFTLMDGMKLEFPKHTVEIEVISASFCWCLLLLFKFLFQNSSVKNISEIIFV